MAGKFADARWVDGTWDLAQFKGADGETDWDKVIDAEARARTPRWGGAPHCGVWKVA